MRKYIALLAALVTALALAVPAVGAQSGALEDVKVKTVEEGKYDSYIVVLKADPLIVSEGKDNLNTKQAKAKGKALAKGHDDLLKDAGIATSEKVHDYVNALNGFSALITYDEAQRVAADDRVAAVYPDTLRQLETETSPAFLGLTGGSGAWNQGLDGEDVIIGVIDTGIWPEHPSFADDGSYSNLGITLDDEDHSACDFGNTAANPNDAPFECNDKLLGARQMMDTYRALTGQALDEFDSARDDDGHGTHTASTAGGNSGVEATVLGEFRGVVSGIAPRARIIAYKGLGNLGGYGSDLAAAIDQAVADGVDVINYSVGGGPSLTGTDDIAYLFAADAGVFVATSASNNGPGPDTIGGPASVPWLTSVGANTHTRTFEGSASSSDGWEFFGASITQGTEELPLVDAADAGDALCNPGALDPDVVDGKIVLCLRGAIARVAKSDAVNQAGGAGMILYNANDAQSEVTDTHWVPSVHINNTDGLVIKDYIATTTDPTAQINGGEATPIQDSVMADFSSRGPNGVAADIIKPDVTAPGVNILAGASPFPDPGSVPGELFQSISGTSMSSPHVAGLFALMKQAHPNWTPAMAKSALMTTSRQDVFKEDGTTAADPFDMGAGHVDPGSPNHKGSMFQPGLVYDAGFNEYLGFLCDAEPSIFANPAGTCASLDSIGVPTDASDLNLASIGVAELAGSQSVTRTVTSVANEKGWRTYKAEVDAPEGYNVVVSPSMIKIKSGQSATYTVTITNETAPVGQWRFGSLTWKGQAGYDVYSPIAVKAALFDTIDAVTGSGESGSGSFDVLFGYTGEYSAAAHGLEPADVTSDSVPQDPDQTFDPTDGYSDEVPINVSGAAYLRIAMPDSVGNPEADIDLFLADPSGTIVAQSTNGGSNELIEVALPGNGTWTLYVHGWLTVDDPVDYEVYVWQVSATPGGNLSVDSAPTSATIGEVGTIDYSWTGASDGQWWLGAVSHTGPGGLLGLTLVEVDNS